MTVYIFILRNIQTYYSWKCPQGFNILPKNGSLAPKEKCRLSATFNPDSAKVYADFAECNYSTKENMDDFTAEDSDGSLFSKVMKMEGIGKFPYVTVYNFPELPQVAPASQCHTEYSTKPVQMLTVQFGCVAIGESVEKYITVENPSAVSIWIVCIIGKLAIILTVITVLYDLYMHSANALCCIGLNCVLRYVCPL